LRLHAQIGAAVEQVDAAYRKEGLLF
jgi:hypothetical protein